MALIAAGNRLSVENPVHDGPETPFPAGLDALARLVLDFVNGHHELALRIPLTENNRKIAGRPVAPQTKRFSRHPTTGSRILDIIRRQGILLSTRGGCIAYRMTSMAMCFATPAYQSDVHACRNETILGPVNTFGSFAPCEASSFQTQRRGREPSWRR